MKTNIYIVGSGNVAWHLGHQLLRSGERIAGIISRNAEAGSFLANELHSTHYDLDEVPSNNGFFIICLKDSVIEEVSSLLQPQISSESIVVHTSGTMPIHVFRPYFSNYGSLYPLQTFTKYKELDFSEIPVFVEGNDDPATHRILQIAEKLSPEIRFLNDNQRLALHVAAVFVCNFANHLYYTASQICNQHHIDFKDLLPLIKETVDKLYTLTPKNAQTGPAVRKDDVTINRHIDFLEQQELKDLYRLMTTLIQQQ